MDRLHGARSAAVVCHRGGHVLAGTKMRIRHRNGRSWRVRAIPSPAGSPRTAAIAALPKAVRVAVVVLVEAGFLYADLILLIGFSWFNNAGPTIAEEASLFAMPICDLTAFILSWVRPKTAAAVLFTSSCVTLLLSISAADSHSFEALWFTGGYFGALSLRLLTFSLDACMSPELQCGSTVLEPCEFGRRDS